MMIDNDTMTLPGKLDTLTPLKPEDRFPTDAYLRWRQAVIDLVMPSCTAAQAPRGK